jgi:UDP-N-acetylmuramate dehydrogenase
VIDEAVYRALGAVAPARRDEPLSRHTTIGIGGPADAFVSPQSADQMREVLTLAHEAGLPVFVLGSGSNIVVGDRGIRGVTIDNRAQHLSAPAAIRNRKDAFMFHAEAGCSFASVSRQLSFAGYEGMEWACGIPGTIGGAVVFNAGAYGGCLGDVLCRIGLWDPLHGETEMDAQALGLSYRNSAFTRGLMADKAVLWGEFTLHTGDANELRKRIAEFDERRLSAQPRGRNAGSFFKNPPGQAAWKLLEAVGMRGYRIGGAEFSEKHCNFLVNTGNATAADVGALKREAQTRVRDQFGLELENEVRLVGEGFGDE